MEAGPSARSCRGSALPSESGLATVESDLERILTTQIDNAVLGAMELSVLVGIIPTDTSYRIGYEISFASPYRGKKYSSFNAATYIVYKNNEQKRSQSSSLWVTII